MCWGISAFSCNRICRDKKNWVQISIFFSLFKVIILSLFTFFFVLLDWLCLKWILHAVLFIITISVLEMAFSFWVIIDWPSLVNIFSQQLEPVPYRPTKCFLTCTKIYVAAALVPLKGSLNLFLSMTRFLIRLYRYTELPMLSGAGNITNFRKIMYHWFISNSTRDPVNSNIDFDVKLTTYYLNLNVRNYHITWMKI